MTQRGEAGAVAVLALAGVVVLRPGWWWVLFAAFLAFDLSMLGYVGSTAPGATTYNAVHHYGVLACAWACHVGVDRALGYGLKLSESSRHTHLGWIGSEAKPS